MFGRHFQVLSIKGQKFSTGQVYVAYRQGMRLRIPLSATNIGCEAILISSSKLTYSSVKEFVSLAEEYALCPTALKPSTQDCPQKDNLKLKTTSH